MFFTNRLFEMQLFFMNVNFDQNNEVDYWIGEKNFAPIFYGQSTIEQILKDDGHNLKPLAFKDAKSFLEIMKARNDCLIVSIGNEYIYFFSQDGDLIELEEYKGDIVKGCNIKTIKKVKIKETPLILASIKANRYLSSGTFKPLSLDKNFGNIKAIEYVLSEEKIQINDFTSYLSCLSSLEFETLIAKVFEELGCFVPAYKGGFIRNYDLFVRNIKEIPISKPGIILDPMEVKSVQIKLNLEDSHINQITDYFFAIKSTQEEPNIFSSSKIESLLASLPITSFWLEQTLFWVQKT
jgi:hypothetical protein